MNRHLVNLWEWGWRHPRLTVPVHTLTIILWIVTAPFTRGRGR